MISSTRRSRSATLSLAAAALTPALSATAQEIELYYTDQLSFVWNDVGSGGVHESSYWAPLIPGGQGVFGFGHAARSDYVPEPFLVVGKAPVGGAGAPFAHPTGFVLIWCDAGSGADEDGCFWTPVAPDGYVALGTVGTSGPVPDPTSVVCVRSDLAVQGTVGAFIYDDTGTGASSDFSAWKIEPPANGIDLGMFVAHASHAMPTATVWCLRKDATDQFAPSAAKLATLVSTFGPVISHHPDETAFPDDPAALLGHPDLLLEWAFVDNEDDYDTFSQTTIGTMPTSSATILDDVQTPLCHPNATDANFRYFLTFPQHLPGDVGRAKAYVRAQPYGEFMTELQFWIFYPWNTAGRIHVSCFQKDIDPTGIAGQHWSDWENVRVRISDRNVWDLGVPELINVVLSRHSFDVEVAAADLQYDGTRPMVFAGRGSHALYTTADRHTYQSMDTGYDVPDFPPCSIYVSLYDLTGNGVIMDTSQPGNWALVSSAWPHMDTATPDWFYFAARWGGYERQAYCYQQLGFDIHCFDQVENGKPGMLKRSEFVVPEPINANLGSLRTSEGVLDPPFDPNVTSYSIDVASDVDSLKLTPQAHDHTATVALVLDGVPYPIETGARLGKASEAIPLDPGENTGSITVSLASGAVRTYDLTINREVEVACPADLDGSGSVDFQDLLLMLVAWGPCVDCPADIDGNDVVDFQDLLSMLVAWGPCDP
jgi:hypothetical protein